MEKYNWHNRLIMACFGYVERLSQEQLTLNLAYGPLLSSEVKLIFENYPSRKVIL